jgi:hypothetical protein
MLRAAQKFGCLAPGPRFSHLGRKRAGAIERCKRAPNVLDADFGRAQLGHRPDMRKSTGDIDLAKTPKDRPKSSIN